LKSREPSCQQSKSSQKLQKNVIFRQKEGQILTCPIGQSKTCLETQHDFSQWIVNTIKENILVYSFGLGSWNFGLNLAKDKPCQKNYNSCRHGNSHIRFSCWSKTRVLFHLCSMSRFCTSSLMLILQAHCASAYVLKLGITSS